ncbi:MAG: hypothetical protein KBD76_12810 [Bacteriovorax sp.]|jgi:hypothetical protein|nr:hypothetical protein [Bacteriovorax sp.]
MDEEQLALVEVGLNLLIKKYKRNANPGDLERMKAAQEAKMALRKVILSVAIKGNIKVITPITERGRGAGWEVIGPDNKTLRYHA